MRKLFKTVALSLIASVTFIACSDLDTAPQNEVPDHVTSQLANLGFDVENMAPIQFRDGYLVEGDIYLTDVTIAEMDQPNYLPTVEQYSTNNLVSTNGNRVITMYAQQASSGGGKGKKGGGSGGYSPGMIAGLDEAISRYNAMNLGISFTRISTDNADITMTRLRKGEERQGILGSAGFPTASGDPYNEIKMSGILESSYGLSTDGIATIIAHEMGHCIGFRHTDYFDRSISCGGGASNEGTAGVGANHIPGTPTGATASAKSFMLACTDGGNRPFNNDDRTALNYLY